jgi:hypothetical protein
MTTARSGIFERRAVFAVTALTRRIAKAFPFSGLEQEAAVDVGQFEHAQGASDRQASWRARGCLGHSK